MRVALAQLLVEYSNKQANLERALAMVDSAAEKGADFVVLPEACDLGWLSNSARLQAESLPGVWTNALIGKAREHRINIISGLTRKEGGKVFNSAIFLDRAGKLRFVFDKINELEVAAPPYARGWKLQAIPTPDFGLVGLYICADAFVPELTASLARMGCKVIFSPVAWAIEPGGEAANLASLKAHYQARCQESKVWLIGADSVGAVTEGPWAGRILQGDSLVCCPEGDFLLEGPTNEPALLVAQIDF